MLLRQKHDSILSFITDGGPRGATVRELTDGLEYTKDGIENMLSFLQRCHKVRVTTGKRCGETVWVATEQE